ncbi:MAG TPA: helix-turn-helix domain-containing protein [Planctomycetaceae bacterium]|jgi:AraC-like DNA-binding protein|nr:helix-turn-helix domain-containing protein [Planctomycetaceae bacterium]
MTDAETELTGLAHDCGYFDQAHFIKEFRAFTGKTPSDTRARCGNSKIM